jgi:Rieske Fe-S protein
MTRREFLIKVAQGAIAAGIGFAAVEAAYLFSYFGPTEGFMSDWKGALPHIDGDGFVVFRDQFLTEEDVADIIMRTGVFVFLFEGEFHGRTEMLPGIVARDSKGDYYASSRKCTHEGCLVDFTDDIVVSSKSYQRVWYCKCHDAVFETSGNGSVLAGPPPTGLPQFDIDFVDGGEKVKLVLR